MWMARSRDGTARAHTPSVPVLVPDLPNHGSDSRDNARVTSHAESFPRCLRALREAGVVDACQAGLTYIP